MNGHSLARSTPRGRLVLVERIVSLGWSAKRAAAALGCSDKTARKWAHRYRRGGFAHLHDRSSRPRCSPTTTPADREALIVQLRMQRRTGTEIARMLSMSKSTVYDVLKRVGLSRLKALDPPEPVVRYEYKRPGGLIHIDVKKLGRIGRPGHRVHGDRTSRVRGIGWEFVHVCIDDHSRLAYVEVLPDETGPSCAGFLRRAVAWYERHGIRVRRVMTDNGSAYRWPTGLFGQLCIVLSLKHIKTRPYRPQTNGKAERFIQTLLREWAYAVAYETSNQRVQALPAWLRYYNRIRPHGSLGGVAPMSRIPQRRNNVLGLHT
jgi:transposase InsO family protein